MSFWEGVKTAASLANPKIGAAIEIYDAFASGNNQRTSSGALRPRSRSQGGSSGLNWGAGTNAIASAYNTIRGGDDVARAFAQDRANYKYNRFAASPAGIRQMAEDAGFNPLVFAGSTGSLIPNYTPTMGRDIANAFAMQADTGNAIEQLKIQRSRLELENRRLEQVAKAASLKPKFGGVYSQKTEQQQAPDVGSLDVVASIDPRRGVKHNPIGSGAGITAIDVPLMGGPIYVPGDQGEPWGIDELVTAVVATPYSVAATKLNNLYPKEPTAPKDGTINLASRFRQRMKLQEQYSKPVNKPSSSNRRSRRRGGWNN